MKRRHLIELHEQPWFPVTPRSLFQRGLSQAQTLLGVYDNMDAPFARFIERTGATAFLDLCSGAAEPIVALHGRLAAHLPADRLPTFVASDLFPDPAKLAATRARFPGVIDFIAEPVDALQVPAGTPRFRSMFSALHHFRPPQVEAILRDAAENADGIAVFEGTGRTWWNMLLTLPIPVTAAFLTLFRLRPFRLTNLLWGLLVPVVPFTALFDGMVSNLRTYTVEELESITARIAVADFHWEVGTVPIPKSPLHATYLFGWRGDTGRPGRGDAAAPTVSPAGRTGGLHDG